MRHLICEALWSAIVATVIQLIRSDLTYVSIRSPGFTKFLKVLGRELSCPAEIDDIWRLSIGHANNASAHRLMHEFADEFATKRWAARNWANSSGSGAKIREAD